MGPGTAKTKRERRGRVILLAGCAGQVLRPSITDAAIRVLARRPADDYAELIDHPVECGELSIGEFEVDVDVGLRQQVAHRAALLVQQGDHEVDRLDKLVVPADRETLGLGQRASLGCR